MMALPQPTELISTTPSHRRMSAALESSRLTRSVPSDDVRVTIGSIMVLIAWLMHSHAVGLGRMQRLQPRCVRLPLMKQPHH
jgi:hypothetical protein